MFGTRSTTTKVTIDPTASQTLPGDEYLAKPSASIPSQDYTGSSSLADPFTQPSTATNPFMNESVNTSESFPRNTTTQTQAGNPETVIEENLLLKQSLGDNPPLPSEMGMGSTDMGFGTSGFGSADVSSSGMGYMGTSSDMGFGSSDLTSSNWQSAPSTTTTSDMYQPLGASGSNPETVIENNLLLKQELGNHPPLPSESAGNPERVIEQNLHLKQQYIDSAPALQKGVHLTLSENDKKTLERAAKTEQQRIDTVTEALNKQRLNVTQLETTNATLSDHAAKLESAREAQLEYERKLKEAQDSQLDISSQLAQAKKAEREKEQLLEQALLAQQSNAGAIEEVLLAERGKTLQLEQLLAAQNKKMVELQSAADAEKANTKVLEEAVCAQKSNITQIEAVERAQPLTVGGEARSKLPGADDKVLEFVQKPYQEGAPGLTFVQKEGETVPYIDETANASSIAETTGKPNPVTKVGDSSVVKHVPEPGSHETLGDRIKHRMDHLKESIKHKMGKD